MADQTVALLHFLDNLRRQWASAGDAEQKFGHMLHGIGAAVREQQDCGLCGLSGSWFYGAHSVSDAGLAAAKVAFAEYSCTNRASALTFSTGVSGKMPWPRLNMCPGARQRGVEYLRARFQFLQSSE